MVSSLASPEPLTALRYIGAVSASRLREVGIATPEALVRVGALEAYRRVNALYPRDTSLVLLYALEAALLDIPWTQLPPDLKARLRDEALGQGA